MLETSLNNALVSLRYVDNYGKATEQYPANPNGSPQGITGLTTEDGRFTIMMPHPERYLHRINHPRWTRENLPEEGDGVAIFRNAYKYITGQDMSP